MASPLYADFFTYPIYDQTTSESFLNATVQLLNEHIDRQAPITILMVLFLCGIFIGQLRIIMIVRTINERHPITVRANLRMNITDDLSNTDDDLFELINNQTINANFNDDSTAGKPSKVRIPLFTESSTRFVPTKPQIVVDESIYNTFPGIEELVAAIFIAILIPMILLAYWLFRDKLKYNRGAPIVVVQKVIKKVHVSNSQNSLPHTPGKTIASDIERQKKERRRRSSTPKKVNSTPKSGQKRGGSGRRHKKMISTKPDASPFQSNESMAKTTDSQAPPTVSRATSSNQTDTKPTDSAEKKSEEKKEDAPAVKELPGKKQESSIDKNAPNEPTKTEKSIDDCVSITEGLTSDETQRSVMSASMKPKVETDMISIPPH